MKYISALFFHATARFAYNYFALVMATGVISLVCEAAGYHRLAFVLLALNTLHYAVCALFALTKLATRPATVWEDLIHSDKGPGYLTMVAGTSMLGVQYGALADLSAAPLLYAGLALYLILIFALIAGIAMSRDKCPPTQGLDGLWLLCTVSGCSLVVLGMSLTGGSGGAALFFTGLWAVSIMLYFIIIPLIFFKWLFSSVNRKDFSPSWWINMGALAIASLAGVKILQNSVDGLFTQVSGVITAVTFFLWAAALWWLALLIIIFVWRTVTRSLDVDFSPGNWSIVFPCGMFALATINVTRVVQIPFPHGLIRLLAAAVGVLWLGFYLWMVVALVKKIRACGRLPNEEA